MAQRYSAIGLMSGTSLDGLDIAYCSFERIDQEWAFEIHHAATVSYTSDLQGELRSAHSLSGEDLQRLHTRLGALHGDWVADFIREHGLKSIDFIASHGHTVLHQPDQGFTLQIASPPEIAARTGLTVIADFRSQDVALGGQGAPLVPVGDRHLFQGYRYYLNIGGIANVTHLDDGAFSAFDVCVANMALNTCAERLGHAFDRDGQLARSGQVNSSLLHALNALPYFARPIPKSLGREFFESEMLPLLNEYTISDVDMLATLVEHIAQQLGQIIGQDSVYITGGGALNGFLIERLRANGVSHLHVPSPQIVQFKEAMVFAFLGVLRLLGEPNCIAAVTGARHDHCSGAIYLP